MARFADQIEYTFMQRRHRWRRLGMIGTQEAGAQNLKLFKNNLGIETGVSTAELSDERTAELSCAIERFADFVHGHAEWYDKRVVLERRWQQIYLLFSIAIIFLTPLAIAFGVPALVTYSQDNAIIQTGDAPAGVITAQITAALTALIAIQRTIGAWLGKRRVLGERWRARTSLIRLILSVERRQAERSMSNKSASRRSLLELLDDVRTTEDAAKDIVDTETQLFFDTYALPEIDAGQSIMSAQTISRNIVDGIRAPIDAAVSKNRERREEARRIEEELRVVSKEVDFLQGKFDEVSKKISEFGGSDAQPRDAQAREGFLRQFAKMKELEAEISAKQAKRLEIELRRKIATL